MKWFQTRPSLAAQYPPEQYEPVIRSSICTGERTACMREKKTGKLLEIMLIRTEQELRDFARDAGVEASSIRTVY